MSALAYVVSLCTSKAFSFVSKAPQGHSIICFILVFLLTGFSLSPQPLSLVPSKAHVSIYFSFPSPWSTGDFL